jgi:hypothetical protein
VALGSHDCVLGGHQASNTKRELLRRDSWIQVFRCAPASSNDLEIADSD